MKRLILHRVTYRPDCTLGKLRVVDDKGDNIVTVSTIELPWKNNEPRVSCIPKGKYPMVLEYSPAFKMRLWELKDVPGRSEVKIHAANYVSQLLGCIAPCLSYAKLNGDEIPDGVHSRKALKYVMDALVGQTTSTIEVE